MKWLDRILGRKPAYVPTVLGRSTKHKIAFHIERFTLAIDQCTNERRLPELQANLDYWRAIEAAEASLEGAA